MFLKNQTFAVAVICLIVFFAYGQNSSPNPATIPSGVGSPASNGLTCAQGMAGLNTSTLYNDRGVSVGNSLYKCSLATDGVTYSWQSPPPYVSGFGVNINQTGISGSMSTQTICAANVCPVGFYHIDVGMVVTTAASLGSLTAATLSFTSDTGSTVNVSLSGCATLSLLIVNNTCAAYYSFYQASTANTVTLSTTVGTITGSPLYDVRAALTKEF